MSKVIAYIRVSSDRQDTDHQELEIRRYIQQHDLQLAKVMTVTMSTRKDMLQRRVQELSDKLYEGDVLIVTEISRLGRSTSEIIRLINDLLNKGVRVIAIKQNLDMHRQDMQSKIVITLFALLAELERDLISLRTKEALASKKAQGKSLGKPKGTIQKSKFDKDLEQIKEFLILGLSVRKISKVLGYKNHIGLNRYIRTRRIREKLKD